jgi:rhamnulokinase
MAVDIGASSGRLMLATLDNDRKLELKEIHRFSNQFQKINGFERWNINYLFNEIITGLEKAKKMGISECTLGIDTWAVDYCLIDKDRKLLNQSISYRDDRTEDTMEKVFENIPKESIYKKTGIQFQNFNTLFQLYEEDKRLIKQTDKILLIPDYLTYLLTGSMINETTNLSTTQLLNIDKQQLDNDLLNLIGMRPDQFPEIVETGSIIGEIKEELHDKFNLPDCTVIAIGTHDTASAIVGVPATNDNWAYLSSGTWSLIGIESKEPIISKESLEANYSNEWGAYRTYRFLKNIPGMWFTQEIAKNLNYKYSFAEMAVEANKVEPFLQEINLEDERFTNPENMIKEIQGYCMERNLVVPKTIGELTMCIYSNLALAYARECERLESLSNQDIKTIHIVGGGSNIELLNQLTANYTGKEVIAGPSEATALGNIMVQLISIGYLKDIDEARKWLAVQIETKNYLPEKLEGEVYEGTKN